MLSQPLEIEMFYDQRAADERGRVETSTDTRVSRLLAHGRTQTWRYAGLAVIGLAIAGLAALPGFLSPYQLRTYTTLLLLALMAQGWNLIGGYTGYAAFGNAA